MFKLFIPALAALSLATTAEAEEPVRVSKTVSYADLDLTTDVGAATLNGRIKAAIKEVCSRPDIRDLAAMASWQKCRSDALETAAARIAEARAPVQFVADRR